MFAREAAIVHALLVNTVYLFLEMEIDQIIVCTTVMNG